MDKLPNLKLLKKIADACRKAGIETFEGYGMKFTILREVPQSNYKKSKEKAQHAQPTTLVDESFDSLPEEDRLFWSVSGIDNFTQNTE